MMSSASAALHGECVDMRFRDVYAHVYLQSYKCLQPRLLEAYGYQANNHGHTNNTERIQRKFCNYELLICKCTLLNILFTLTFCHSRINFPRSNRMRAER